jgi:hypothetical protein
MSNNSCDIELDITEGYQYYPPSTQSSSSSSRSPLVNQQPTDHAIPRPSESITAVDHMPSYIDVTTISDLEVNVSWVDTTSERIKIGSLVRVRGRQEPYMVIGVVRRSARKLTVMCTAKSGHTIGLVVGSGHLEQTWKELFKRHLLLTFCLCILL